MRAGTQPLQSASVVHRGGHRGKFLVSILSALLAVLTLLSMVSASFGSIEFTNVFATSEEDNEAEETMQEAADDYGVEGSQEGFEDALDKAYAEDEANMDTFSGVLNRVFSTGYLNNVEKASPPFGDRKEADFLCDTNNGASGTLVYHNCDIPNMVTEFFQDAIGNFTLYGVQNGHRTSSTVSSRWFGLPNGIPDNNVPVNPDERSVEYTALEVFGYSPLRYTTYAGEWDHIKTMSEARALSNYGAMDKFKLGANSIANSIAGGVDGAVDGWQAGMESGGIFSAIGGSFTGLIEGAASSGVNTILDTSDYNVAYANGWYRSYIGETLYNARELTQQEMSAEAQQQFINMISSSQPDEGEIPEELQEVETLPEPPEDAIASCEYENASGGTSSLPANSSPGPTEAECETAGERAADQANEEDGVTVNANWTWDEEGTREKETIDEWVEEHDNYFTVGNRYGITCGISRDEDARAEAWADFSSCWNARYDAAAEEARQDQQREENDNWVVDFLGPEAFLKYMQDNPEANFNAPHSRFVCVDDDGNDVRDSNNVLQKVYSSDGTRNTDCEAPTRQPIQSGLFGNGYSPKENREIGVDTRHQNADGAIMNIVLPIDHVSSTIANGLLTISVFITRISNTAINLSFTPIFETIGLDEIAVSFIENIRDSLYFPLALLVLGVAGIAIIWNAFRQRNYLRQLGSILIITLTFVLGMIIMVRPAETIKMVDTVPAMVEQAALGAIFSAGSAPEDTMCQATGTVTEESTPQNLDGSVGRYNPSSGLRSLMCENWRAFAFTPWVYGQFGTGMSDLYGATADVNGSNNVVENDNTFRVGSPTVDFGNNTTMNNWAIYQLDAMSTGTATSYDYRPGNLPGSTDSDMYRLVDFQAGPNNGLGTDDRFFESWTGQNAAERLGVAGTSTVVATFGAVTIIAYSITKVTITFVSTVLLMFLPFMLLFGLYPGAGMRKLRGYVGSIIALMLQRIMIAVMLAIMLTIIMAASNTDGDYFLVAFLTIAVSVFFLSFRKQMMRWIAQATEATAGSSFASGAVSDPDKATKDAVTKGSPGVVRNSIQAASGAAAGFVTGGTGSFLAGDGFMNGARTSIKSNIGRLHNVQRRKGFGFIQGSAVAMNAARQDAIQNQDRDQRIRELSSELAGETEKTKAQGDYDAVQTYADENTPGGNLHGATQDDDAEDTKPTLGTADTGKTRRELGRIKAMEDKIDRLKAQGVRKQVDSTGSRANRSEQRLQDNRDIETMSRQQQANRDLRRDEYQKMLEEDASMARGENGEQYSANFEDYAGYDLDHETRREIFALENQIESAKNKIIQREDSNYRHSTEDVKMRHALEDLVRETERERQQAESNGGPEYEGDGQPDRQQEQYQPPNSGGGHGYDERLARFNTNAEVAIASLPGNDAGAVQRMLSANTEHGDLTFLEYSKDIDIPAVQQLRDDVEQRMIWRREGE